MAWGLNRWTGSLNTWRYDIESRDPTRGTLRFIEVKGRAVDAQTITVTHNEILSLLKGK